MVEGKKMAGNSKKPDGRGGARPGAGRKPTTLSAWQVDNLLKTLARKAKETGKDIDQLLVDKVYDEQLSDRNFLASVKLVKDLTQPKLTEGGEADKTLGPSIYLPEQKPTLAAVADINKNKKDSKGET